MLINAGIKEIVYGEGYDDPLADEMLTEAGITMERFVL
jgi:dCMP deaminase